MEDGRFPEKDLAGFLAGLPCGQRRGLGQHVGPQFLLVPDPIEGSFIHPVLRVQHADKIDGERFPLMGQLEERVLGIGARFTKDYRTGGFGKRSARSIHRFPVAFHIQLLDMRGQLGQRRRVRDDGGLGIPQETGVPYAEQGGNQGKVLRWRRLRGMPVHFFRAFQEAFESFISQVQAKRHTADR